VDSFGIEIIHPRRAGRSDKQIGSKGKSNHRWIIGAKLCFILDHLGRVVDWDVDTANVYDAVFQPLIEKYENTMLIETVFSMLTHTYRLKRVGHRV
jgi:hypothetical protein